MAVTTTIPFVRVVAALSDSDPSRRVLDYMGKVQGAIPHPGANNCPEKGPGIEAEADREGLGTTLLYAHRFSLLLYLTDRLKENARLKEWCRCSRATSCLRGSNQENMNAPVSYGRSAWQVRLAIGM